VVRRALASGESCRNPINLRATWFLFVAPITASLLLVFWGLFQLVSSAVNAGTAVTSWLTNA
jgi:hypothetical protein